MLKSHNADSHNRKAFVKPLKTDDCASVRTYDVTGTMQRHARLIAVDVYINFQEDGRVMCRVEIMGTDTSVTLSPQCENESAAQ